MILGTFINFNDRKLPFDRKWSLNLENRCTLCLYVIRVENMILVFHVKIVINNSVEFNRYELS